MKHSRKFLIGSLLLFSLLFAWTACIVPVGGGGGGGWRDGGGRGWYGGHEGGGYIHPGGGGHGRR
jgi:hypothetical protein